MSQMRTFSEAVILVVLLLNLGLYKLLSASDVCCTVSDVVTQQLHISNTHTELSATCRVEQQTLKKKKIPQRQPGPLAWKLIRFITL